MNVHKIEEDEIILQEIETENTGTMLIDAKADASSVVRRVTKRETAPTPEEEIVAETDIAGELLHLSMIESVIETIIAEVAIVAIAEIDDHILVTIHAANMGVNTKTAGIEIGATVMRSIVALSLPIEMRNVKTLKKMVLKIRLLKQANITILTS